MRFREAARQAHLKALEEVHREKVAAAHREHAAGVARQKKLLRELGLRDWTPEEFEAEVQARGGFYVRGDKREG